MKNISFFVFIIFSISLASCGADFFETTVEIDLPDHESTLAVSSILSLDSESSEVFISKSLSLNATDPLQEINDAQVQLFKNGNVIGDFVYDDDENIYVSGLEPTDLESGATYRIETSHPDYPTISAEAVMPKVVDIKEAEYLPESTAGQFGDQLDEYRIKFDDPGDEENYYLIYVNVLTEDFFVDFNGDTTFYRQNIYDIESRDPSVVFGFDNLSYQGVPMISDAAFNGKTYQLIFQAWPNFFDDGDEIEIELVSITRERYLYLLSLQRFMETDGNPFAEPVTVVSNVENGQGNFGLQAADRFLIKI